MRIEVDNNVDEDNDEDEEDDSEEEVEEGDDQEDAGGWNNVNADSNGEEVEVVEDLLNMYFASGVSISYATVMYN